MLINNKKIGRWGESLAKQFFVEHGYKIMAGNWAKKMGEIDLIVQAGKELVFVEVKTRTTPYCGWGEEAVDVAKKKKISVLIDCFLSENKKYQKYYPRFDILVVELIELTPNFIHYENVILN